MASFHFKEMSFYRYLNKAHEILILRTPLLIMTILEGLN